MYAGIWNGGTARGMVGGGGGQHTKPTCRTRVDLYLT